VVLLLAISAVPVFAAESPPAPDEIAAPPTPADFDPKKLPGEADIAAALDEAERQEEARNAWLESPAARKEREDSRLAYAELDASSSRALLNSVFAEQLSRLNEDPARVLSDAELLRSGEGFATIRDEGDNSLMESSLPTRTEDENGELRKVDLSLKESAEGFETENALVEVQIPRTSDEPIMVGEEGVSVELVGAEEQVVQPFGDENLFAPEVLPDTDMLISPISTGAEIFNVLRSERSPETLRFQIGMPSGAMLRADGGWGAEVVKDGRVLTTIPEPVAIDAQGTDVPVDLQVAGNSLLLSINHRGGNYAMPILLDPILENNENWIYGQNYDALDMGLWAFTKNVAGMYGSTGCIYHCFGQPSDVRGLFVSGQSGTYWPNQYAQWSYSAPNANSFITSVTLSPWVRYDHGCNAATTPYKQPHDYFGIWNGSEWVQPPSVNSTNQYGNQWTLPYDGQAVVFGLGSGGSQFSIPCWRDIYAGGAHVWLDDWANPGFSAPSGVPSGWIDGKTQFTISTTASDAGLGVNRVKLLSDGQAIVGDANPNQCTGTRRSPCPNNYNAAFTQTGGSFGQGVRSAKIYVSDPTGKSAESASIPLKVDLTPPDVTLEGKLAAATDADEGEAKGDADVETLRLPVYNLTIKATDEGTETNTEHRKRSGVKDIEIWLQEEGQPKKEMPVPWSPTPSCVASCPKEGTYKLELSKLDTAGTHRLEVRTIDFVGNEKVRDIEFEYFPATGMKDEYVMHHFPLPDGQESEDEDQQQRQPELAVNVMNGNLVYRQKDLDVESTAAIDLEVERYYNSMLPNSENSEWGDGWTLAETPDLKTPGGSALAAVATMAVDPSLSERYFSLWMDMPTPAGTRAGYELNFKLVSANTYDVALSRWQAGAKTQLAAKSGVSFAAGNSLALVDEGATVSAWANAGSGFVRVLSAVDAAFDEGKAGLFGAGNIVRLAKFKAGEMELPSGIPAALAAMPVTEPFDGSSASNARFAAEWSALGWAGGGTPKGATTTVGWRPVDAFTTAANGAYLNQNLAVAAGGASEQAELLDSSGAIETAVDLPAVAGEGKFDPELQATLEKRTGGGFHLIDESGESGTAVAFDETGQTEALLAGGDVKVDYSYEGGELAEITVEDPGTLHADPSEVESSEPQATEGTPLFHSTFGSFGAGDSQFNTPTDVALGPEGDLWVADYANNRLQHLNPAGEYVGQFGSQGSGAGKLSNPASIAIDAESNIWVADKGNSRIQKFSPEGALLDGFGSLGSGNGQFNRPEGIAIDASGDIWVSDTYNYRIQKFSDEGDFIEVVAPEGLGSIEPTGIDAGPGGKVWVADWTHNRVAVLSEGGDFELSFGTAGSGPGQFDRPDAIEVDENGNVWVGDQNNGRIQRFDQEGKFVDQFGAKGSGPGQFSFGYPFGFAVGEDRRIWVADRNNHRVQRWDPPYEVSEETLPEDDDPSVEVETEAGLVTSVAGEEAGEIAYEHSSGLLTSVDGPDGETAYEYKDGRMTKVTLPNGTYGTISYFPDGRVEAVTVAPEGANPKTTRFAYTDVGQRKTEVEVPEAPNITYEIGDDGSLLKWWNTAQPPELILWGNLYDQKENEGALWPGDYQLTAKAEDVEGLASIEVLAGNALVEEFSCQQVGGPPPECTKPDALPWVMETEAYAPGRLQIEVVATDSDGESTSERFWVDVPEPPPPPAPGTPVAPRFSEIKTFREDYGLEVVFPVANATERNERIFNLINAWHEPNTPLGQVARASQERWGVPLRPEDVAEMEYREWFLATNGAVLDSWFESAQPTVYAGYYIDHRAGGVFRIGFTDDQESAIEVLKNALPLVAKERMATFPTEPAYDWKTLNGAEDTLIESLPTNSALDSAMSNIKLSAQENRVEMFTQGVPAAEAAVNSVLGGSHPVIFRYTPNLLESMSGRTRVKGPMLAGDRIFNLLSKGCTAGFGTYKLGKKQANGSRPEIDYLLTAGHCSNEEEGVYYRSEDSGKAFGEVRIDPWTNGPKFGMDAEAVLLKNPDVVPRAIYTDGPRHWGVQPAKQAFVGDLVYFSGATTGSPNPHGEVVGRAKGAVKRPNGRSSGGYWVDFNRPVQDGDSGAPVFKSDGSAIGLVIGGWIDPDGRRLTLVEPLLHPPNMRPGLIPGILHSNAMKPMYMRTGPGP
jgi:streptogramin lyase